MPKANLTNIAAKEARRATKYADLEEVVLCGPLSNTSSSMSFYRVGQHKVEALYLNIETGWVVMKIGGKVIDISQSYIQHVTRSNAAEHQLPCSSK